MNVCHNLPRFSLVYLTILLVAHSVAAGRVSDPPGVEFSKPQRDSINVGDEAPSFVMREAFTDNPVFLSDYTGKNLRQPWKKKERHAVVISFWASWCEPCKEEIPLLTKMAADFESDPVKIFLVNTREYSEFTEDSVKVLLKKRGYTLPCLLDATGSVADRYTVWGLPMIVVIDKYGIIRKVNRGFHQDFDVEIRELLRDILKEEKPG